MPTPTFRVRHVVSAILAGVLLAISLASVAEAKPTSRPAEFRVVDPTGRLLADGTQFTGPTKVRTSKKANCFGPGTAGSGAAVDIPGSTALGQLAEAATAFPKAGPLGITDAFDFGLGLCSIGKAVAPPTGFWYLKVNHAASLQGAEGTEVARGDEVLWYLIEDFSQPTPDELVLAAPATAGKGKLAVKVLSYSDDGTKSPAAGVEVTGADGPTNAEGRTTVTLGPGVTKLRATRDGSIASNVVRVCTDRVADCPPGYAETIGGTSRKDTITAGAEAETIFAGSGRDEIDARRGKARDKINCGPGKDTLILKRGSRSKLRKCERVRYR